MRQYPALISYQLREQAILERSQFYSPAGEENLAGGEIDCQATTIGNNIKNQVSFGGGIWLLTFHSLRDATYLSPIVSGVHQEPLPTMHSVRMTISLPFFVIVPEREMLSLSYLSRGEPLPLLYPCF